MRNLKKFLALVLAMMMTLSLMVTVNASSFKDADDINTKYGEAVNVLTELGVVNGYNQADGTTTFDPKANITRAEVAAILYRIVTGDVKDSNIHLYKGYSEFTDVDSALWYAPYINFCANNALILGVGNGKFEPKENVTGYQALVMILRAMGYNNPTEFSSSDWKLKASGYGARLEITSNIPSGSLGAPATREMVVEIMFQAIQKPMVNYSILNNYTVDLLVDASEVGDGTVYAADVPNTLLYQTFKIVGKRVDVANDCVVLGEDNYGRPVEEWVKDLATDTVANGGKYIVNPVASKTLTAGDAMDVTTVGTAVSTMASAPTAGQSYVPVRTPGASYAVAGTTKPEGAALKISMAPIYTFHDVMSECNLVKAINNDKSIDAEHNLTEWLNGAKVATRTGYTMDALHTATGGAAQELTVGAAGRTTEVFKTGEDADGDAIFVFVYIDTLMGVVTDITPRTFDTAGHVMSAAEMTIKVNDTVNAVKYTSRTSDFAEYKKGSPVLLTTWGGANKNPDATDATKPGTDDTAVTPVVATLQRSVPTVEDDFVWDDSDTAATHSYIWAVDVLPNLPTTATFTVNATKGSQLNKTALVSADNKTYTANIGYLANENDDSNNGGIGYYQTDGTTKITAQTTVPGATDSTPDYGVPMVNARIGQEVTAVIDHHGYVVGLTMSASTSDVGVVTGIDSVRLGYQKYAIEAQLLMMDGTEKTIRLLDLANGAATSTAKYFETATDADTGIDDAGHNCKINVDVLVRIKPYTKDGATYYEVKATNAGANADFAASEADDDAIVRTGVANTLAANGTTIAHPATFTDMAAPDTQYLNDNTCFIVAEYDYRYNEGNANEGAYGKLLYKTYKGFKNLPTITGNNGANDANNPGTEKELLYQKIGNNVFILPQTDTAKIAVNNRRYTITEQATYAVDDTYLLLAPIATYADHATYKALKDGVETTIDVVNNNAALNGQVEAAMNAGNLIKLASKNSAGYATGVTVLSGTTYTFAAMGTANRTIAVAKDLQFYKDGVIFNNTADKTFIGVAATDWLTVADDCKVVIVNLLNGSFVNGTLDSIMQYENFVNPGSAANKDTAPNGHRFVYELDQYGYVSTLYILD